MIKVGVIIPDRGDRPRFLENCFWMLQRQTKKPTRVELINHAPLSDRVDITWRYRKGYELFNTGDPVDVIAFIENDDWYGPQYLEYMVHEWVKHGKPDLFGTNTSTYYHLKHKKYFSMFHDERACAMNTLIRPGLNFSWGADDNPYTDIHLWVIEKTLKRKLFRPEYIMSLGIKHGVGLCGGDYHDDGKRQERMNRYNIDDNGFLKATLDPHSFDFYDNYFKYGQ